ncbi:hypothetical protein MLD38_015505 [Melastoma candidum]|uniref:Uncharacterized protein n=1 Tax=Melastoma candidum TaxID=119954 RepID=A0ACB9RG49_9MYRT|nr:hypothetical protein MLD38_015505 [Melastoma candidum]
MICYGIYLFVEYEKSSGKTVSVLYADAGVDLFELGRPMLLVVRVPLSSSSLDDLSKACFFHWDIGVVLFIISL